MDNRVCLYILTLAFQLIVPFFTFAQSECAEAMASLDQMYWERDPDFERLLTDLEKCDLSFSDETMVKAIQMLYGLDQSNFQAVDDAMAVTLPDTNEISGALKARIYLLNGMINLEKTRFSGANKQLRKAMKLFERYDLTQNPWYAKALIEGMNCASWSNHLDYADSLLMKLQDVWKSTEEMPLLIDVQHGLAKGFLEGKQGKLAESISSYQQTIELASGFPQYDVFIAEAYGNLGTTFVTKFKLDSADLLLNRSLQTFRAIPDTMNIAFSNALDQLGVVAYYRGAYDQALPLMLRSFKVVDLLFEEDHEAYGSRTSNISVVYEKLGQYEKSLDFVKKSLINTELVFGKSHPLYWTTFNNYGLTLTRLKRNDEAKTTFLTLLEMMQDAGADGSNRYGLYLDNLGRVYMNMNQLDSAEMCYTRAVELAEQHNGRNHYYYIIRKNNLAGVFTRQGKLNESLQIYKDLIEPTKVAFGTNHPQFGIRMSNLASAYEDIGDFSNASLCYDTSTHNLINQFYNYYPTLSAENKIQYLNQHRDWLDKHFSFVVNGDMYDAGGYLQDLNLAIKGLALGSHLTIRREGDADLLEEWKDVRTKIGQLMVKRQSDQLGDSLARLSAQAEQLELMLLTRYPHDFHLSKLDYDDISQSLEQGEVAIDLFHFQYMDGPNYTDSILYGAIINRSDLSIPKTVILGEEKQLSEALEEFQINGSTKELSELIWDKLDPYVEGKIYLSPAGMTNKVPFHILQTSTGSMVMDRYEIHMFQSLRDFIKRKSTGSLEIDAIALFGDPDFNFEPKSRGGEEDTAMALQLSNLLAANVRSIMIDSTRGLQGFNQLPGTRQEIEKIRQIAQTNSWNIDIFSSEQASEANFSARSRAGYDIIHMATHGFFLPHRGIEEGESNRRNILISQENPMLRSGLAMAGINKLWLADQQVSDGNDGVLTAYEISNLDLSSTKLVVLSACETGLGDYQNAEGVYGLQRAFRQAGVDQLVISLWKIPDNQTAELMHIFYENLADQGDAYSALRHAQRQLAQKYPPYYWAGFVLIE